MHLSKTFPKALLVLMLVFAFLFVSAPPAQADILGDILEGFGDFVLGGPIGVIIGQFTGFHVSSIVGGAVGGLAATIAKALASLASTLIFIITIAFFAIAGSLIGTALEFNSKINLIAETGYNTTLGVANMLFIVALVVIAFATMLRQEGFGYKKALPRVVIAALLINFGFFIVTNWFIAPVNQVTEAIKSATSLDIDSLAKVFSINNLFGQFTNFSDFKDVGGAFGEVGKAAASVLAAAAFSFIGIISLFAFAVMLFIRGVALGLLLILLPLAWIAWIFPNLKLPGGINPWQEWWQSFIRWLLFAPFAMFFLWLSIQLANQGGLFPDPDKNLYSAIGQMIVVSGLILGGLFVSNRMGITGAGIALGAVAAGRVWAKGQAAKYGRKTGYWAYKQGGLGDLAKKAETYETKKLGRFGRAITAPIRGTGRRVTRTAEGFHAARGAEFRKKLENLAPFQVDEMYAGLSEPDRAEALKYMIEKGYDWELNPQARQDVINWAEKEYGGKGHFANNVWGLKKAELDMIDMGVSPNAIAAQAQYKGELREAYKEFKEAKDGGAPKTALQARLKNMRRIKFEGQRKMREVYYKELNVIPATAMSKLQRRMFSAPTYDEKTGEWKTPYRMFGGTAEDKDNFLEMQGMLVDYLHEERPYAVPRVRGAVRGDGAARIARGTRKHVKGFRQEFIEPLTTASGISFDDLARQRDQQLERFEDHWDAIQTHRRDLARVQADQEAIRQGLTPTQRDELLKRLTAEVNRMTPEEAVQDFQQLLIATRGSAHATFSG